MTKLLALANPWVLLAVAGFLAAFGWFAYSQGYANGENAVQVRWDMSMADQRRADDDQRAKNKAAADDLQTKADAAERIKNERNRTLEATVATLRRELQQRPSRPAPQQPGEPSAVSCAATRTTGAGLYAEDSEFLVGEAARASRHRNALAQCYERVDQYEGMQRALSQP